MYTVSSDSGRLDMERIVHWLSESSYWAQGRPRAAIERSIAGSIPFGVYEGNVQIAFARVVTDGATFGWLCDVFVDEAHRGRGVGKLLIRSVVADPRVRSVRVVLATRDAQGFYETYGGFHALEKPERWMTRRADSQEPSCAQ